MEHKIQRLKQYLQNEVSQPPTTLSSKEEVVFFLRYIQNIDWYPSATVLKTIILCFDLIDNKYKALANILNHFDYCVEIPPANDIPSQQIAHYNFVVSKSLSLFQVYAKQDVFAELQILMSQTTELNNLSKSKHQLIAQIRQYFQNIIVQKAQKCEKLINRPLDNFQCEEQFKTFYNHYCTFCGINKKFSYLKWKNIHSYPIDQQQNALIQKRYLNYQ